MQLASGRAVLAALTLYSASAAAGPSVLRAYTADRASGPIVVDTETVYGSRDAGAFGRDGIEGRVAGSLRLGGDLRLGLAAGAVRNDELDRSEFSTGMELSWLPGDSRFDGGLGLKRGYDGARIPYARLGWQGALLARPVSAVAVFETPRADNRDAADVLVGAAMNVYADERLRWNLEFAGEDLEGLWESEEAEGGAKFILGPSLGYRSSPTTSLRIMAGWIYAATTNTPRREGLPDYSGQRNGIMARVQLSYDRLRY